MDDERGKLIKAVRNLQGQEEARQMPEAQLLQMLCSWLGLPRGTTFSEEQLEMIASCPVRAARSNSTPRHSRRRLLAP